MVVARGFPWLLAITFNAVACLPVLAQAIPIWPTLPADPTPLLDALDRPPSQRGRFQLAVSGDLILTQPVTGDKDHPVDGVFARLRAADLAVANAEGTIASLATPGLVPAGNGMLLMKPGMAREIARMGIDLVSLANNHGTDWGEAGLRETMRLLDEAGVAHAGGGLTLAHARAPTYVTERGVRVAMVSTASTFIPSAMANDAVDGMPARAGISVLRTTRTLLVSAEELNDLRPVAARASFGRNPPPTADATDIVIGEERFGASDRRGYTYVVNPYDLYDVLDGIHSARRSADLVVFSIHAHESATGRDDDNPDPADFLPDLFHKAVEAGADVIVGGGPHALRGIEIYKGRPIFYGIGTLFLNGEIYASQELRQDIAAARINQGPPTQTVKIARANGGNPRNWYSSVIGLIDFLDGRAIGVRLIPLDLDPDGDRIHRGVPRVATGARAREIIARLAEDSRRFGTSIVFDGDTGYIGLP